MTDDRTSNDPGSQQVGKSQIQDDPILPAASAAQSDSGVIGQALAAISRLYPVPRPAVRPLLVAGLILGAAGDALLHSPERLGFNFSLWIALVAVAALILQHRATLSLPRERVTWLALGALFAAGLSWRDAPPLSLLALGCATLLFALAAHRLSARWVRSSGVLRYAGALALGAFHAWTAAAIALADGLRSPSRSRTSRATGWRSAMAIARGLLIAAPLVFLFGALFMSADAVFSELVANVLRFDFEWIATHGLLFAILTWISTGYLRGFLAGTDIPPLSVSPREGTRFGFSPKRPMLGITEVATALVVLDLLFLLFVLVQFRYLFGGDTLVQVTPGLTYADYARRGFFELVLTVVLVVPVLLSADWLLRRRIPRDTFIFRILAGVQIGLVLAITASALQRLRLYHASYGLTESRFYAMVLLLWIGAMLLWLAVTVLRDRRHAFAFGALASGLATIALLFVINPDAFIARVNMERMASADASVRFDVAYATRLSADAVPVLLSLLPSLSPDVQCPLAQHLLRKWPPQRQRSLRHWNWSEAQASRAVRQHEADLQRMAGPGRSCVTPSSP